MSSVITCAACQALLTYDDLDRIKVYAQTKSWWDTIDSLDQTIGAIGLRDHRVDERMLAWAQDADFWLRRIAIDHQLGRKERTNTALLEQILVWNLGSEEFFINKAIGWSLREYSKQDPAWVRAFIDAHREAMSALSHPGSEPLPLRSRSAGFDETGHHFLSVGPYRDMIQMKLLP